MAECEECGADVDMPFSCRRCGKQLCPSCRLPESHACPGQAVDVDLEKGSTRRRPTGKLSDAQRFGGSANPLRDERSAITGAIITGLSYLALPFILLYNVVLYGLSLLGTAWRPLTVIVVLIGAVYAGPALGVYGSPFDAGGTAETPAQTGVDKLDKALLREKIHERVNEVRVNRGLDELSQSDKLHQVAKYHSEDMAESDYFAHTSPSGETVEDRYRSHNIDCSAIAGSNTGGGENIASTYAFTSVQTQDGVERYSNETELADSIVEQWMTSQGHRENLLSKSWEAEGIGISLEQTEDGVRVLVTENFC